MCVSSQIIAVNTMFLFHRLMILYAHKDIYCFIHGCVNIPHSDLGRYYVCSAVSSDLANI